MKLLFSPFSPYVRKCLVTANELGLDGRISLLASAANPVNRDQTIIPHNPLGKVPTFFTDDGEALYDSRVICEYLNDLAKGGIFPAAGTARWRALTLQSLGDGILDAAILARYEVFLRPEPLRWEDWSRGQRDKIRTSLAHLNANPSMLSAEITIGNIAVGCALWYLDLRFADFGWRETYPEVAKWYAAYSQRPSMKMTWALPS
ncbi:MAG: glutathione S-transferase [Burkholderiaceae bacterium]|jgi:glutathione S-transferase|nr:glutathione S-transferase [Betaproteobacteria bacterium]